MLIFNYTQKYSQDTGEPSGYKREIQEEVCDLSGEPFGDHWTEQPLARYNFDYGNKDWGGSPNTTVLRDRFCIDSKDLVLPDRCGTKWKANDYVVKQKYEENRLMGEMAESDIDRISAFFKKMRTETVIELLEEGTYKPHQIPGFTWPPDQIPKWREVIEEKDRLDEFYRSA